MKAQLSALAVLCVQIGLSHAIPHARNGHQNLHAKREIATAFVTKTNIVTVTEYDAVVWVDTKGVIMKTVQKSPATAAVAATKSSPSVAVVPTPAAAIPTNLQANDSDRQKAAKPKIPDIATSSVKQAQDDVPTPERKQNAIGAASVSGFSVAYDPIGSAGCRNADADFAYLAGKGFKLVRVYDKGCELKQHVDAAAAHGLKLMVGLNGIGSLNADLNTISNWIISTSAGWSVIDTVYIGNEVVRVGAASAEQVAQAVSVAKGILSTKGFSGSVITVDSFDRIIANPTICSTSDYCGANIHAFFDPNTAAADAGSFVKTQYDLVKSAVGGKRVVIAETGWPYGGSANGQAIPSPDNQRIALESIMSQFGFMAGDTYLFQAWDASYKAGGPFGVETHFGIFDSNHYNGQP